MIRQIELKNFKCFEILKLPLNQLSLLSGTNASGKSSLLQSLVLLNQTIRENEWSSKLILNGQILTLGTVQDVVNKIHGRREFELAISDDEGKYCWRFTGDRDEMSMTIEYLSPEHIASRTTPNLRKLLPFTANHAYAISSTLELLTYITAERIGPQDYYSLEDRRAVQTVGTKGEYAVSQLFRLADKDVSNHMIVESASTTKLVHQVEAWMQRFFPGCGIAVERIERVNALTLGIRTSAETDYHRPVNVGFGLTQILPILVAVLSADRDDLILIENPEVHLHPAGQALMGEFLALAAQAGPQVIIETHSDHILNGVRRTVRKQVLSPQNVVLHFFRSIVPGQDQVVSPQLDQSGNIDFWPDGFFDQYDKDLNYFAGWGE